MKGLVLSKDGIERHQKRIVEAIRDFVFEAEAKGAVFGLSGGIDSALVGALARRALGNRVLALIMPEAGVSNEEDVEHAVTFAKEKEIQFRIIELNETLDSVRRAYADLLHKKRGFLARANLVPRARMLFNYAVSNMEGRIVLGTGNKTELLLGYFTKYGDGGVDFLPIGDLYKTQVRQLASYLGLPQHIIDKPPSAGLWRGQTDEGELGESYENIDKILFLLHDKGYSIEKTPSVLKLDRRVIEKISVRMEKNMHKRTSPQIVRLS